MVITVVAPELCMRAVAAAPMPTPASLFEDVLANICFNLLELADSRFELIIWQAIRKIPMPDKRISSAETILTVPIVYSL